MKSFFRMTYPYCLWIGIFIVAPMIMILLYALTRTTSNSVLTFEFTLDNFSRFFTDPLFPKILLKSLKVALITTVICLLVGYPMAMFISGRTEKVQTVLILLLTLPMWINMLLKTYAWRGILEDMKMDSEIKVFIGMVYDFLPYMIIQIHTAISKLDRDLFTASYDLGANKFQTFRKVMLPLSVPGIISGITLVFLPAVSSFAIPQMLGGGDYQLIGSLIEQYFITTGEWNFGSAISLLMALIIILSMRMTRKLDREASAEEA